MCIRDRLLSGYALNRPHMCAERLGTAPDETAVFEDSPHAAKTAFENGFYTVGVNSGHFGDFDVLADCTDIRINSFKDLC